MASDAAAIYRQFVKTPLRIKGRTSENKPSTTHDQEKTSQKGSSSASSVPEAREIQQLQEQIHYTKLEDHATISPSDPTDSALIQADCSDGSQHQEGSIQHDDDASTTAGQHSCSLDVLHPNRNNASRPKDNQSGVTAQMANAQTENTADTSLRRSSRRKTSVVNNEGQRPHLITPTELTKPTKRRRKNNQTMQVEELASEMQEQSEITCSTVTTVLDFIEEPCCPTSSCPSPGEQATIAPSKSPIAVEPPSVVDSKKPFGSICESLCATTTISGYLFSLCFDLLINSLETQQEHDSVDRLVEFCMEITNFEHIARESELKQDLHEPQRRQTHSPAAATTGRRRESPSTAPRSRSKKQVRFQSFDMSCLSLHYETDAEDVLQMLDQMLLAYKTMLQQAHQLQESGNEVVELFMNGLLDRNQKLFDPEHHANRCIFDQSFGLHPEYVQSEIRKARVFYCEQFQKLTRPSEQKVELVDKNTKRCFFEEAFSPVVSSLVRYHLRIVFLAAEETTHEELEKENQRVHIERENTSGSPLLSKHPHLDELYDHQDLGAAVHHALREQLAFEEFLSTCGLLSDDLSVGNDQLDAMLQQRSTYELEELQVLVKNYAFLVEKLTTCWSRRTQDGFVHDTWSRIQDTCRFAQQWNLQDEAHLFPLSSMEQYLKTLGALCCSTKHLSDSLARVQQKRKNAAAVCGECNLALRRKASAIECTRCQRQYHVRCLDLPKSFVTVASHSYTCPQCYLQSKPRPVDT